MFQIYKKKHTGVNWYENLFEFIRYFQVLRYEFLNIYANF